MNAMLDKGASASEVSDKIKDMLFTKSAKRVDDVKPDVATNMFGDKEEEDNTEPEAKVDDGAETESEE